MKTLRSSKKHPCARDFLLGLFILAALAFCGCDSAPQGIDFLTVDKGGWLGMQNFQNGILYSQDAQTLTILDSGGQLQSYAMSQVTVVPQGGILNPGQTLQIASVWSSFLDDGQQTRYVAQILDPPSRFTLSALWDYKIRQAVSNMTLEEKVGQLFYVSLPAAEAPAALGRYGFGGVLLTGQDAQDLTADQLKERIAGYQSASQIPLLVGTDEEGGDVVRISSNTALRNTPFASPQALLASGSLDAVKKDTAEKDAFLKAFGINMNFAPVCDISTNPSDYIYSRTAGLDAQGTASYVSAVVAQMEADGMGSVLKHFPGWGSSGDTRLGTVQDTRPMERLISQDLMPFNAGLNKGASMVLVGHTTVTALDKDQPASLSKAVHEFLRKSLTDDDGLIISDSLDMGAVTQTASPGDAAVAAFAAGNDMVITSNYAQQIPAVTAAVKAGTISEDQIDASVRRILTLKVHLGLISFQ
jgi:beta-N-acetylhexosaminidase